MSCTENCGNFSPIHGAPIADRMPRILGSYSASPTQPIRCGVSGWIEFAGQHDGWTVAYDDLPPVNVYPGDMLPNPLSGRFTLVAGTGSLKLRQWREEEGRILAAGRSGAMRASSPKSTATSTVALGLTTAAAAGVQIVASASRAMVVKVTGDQNNTVGAFLAETQGKAALLGAAGGGSPVYAAGEKEWCVPAGGNLWVASAGSVALVYADQST